MRRHVLTSLGINAALSAGFFLLVFGLSPRPLSWGAPGRLALDFLPQSAIVALMSALVPVLIAVREAAWRPGLPGRRAIVVRAFAFAIGGLGFGGLLALLVPAIVPVVAWLPALLAKVAYGGLLGAAITFLVLRRFFA
jgi:hypothetical protein